MQLLIGAYQYFLQYQPRFWQALGQHLELSVTALVVSILVCLPLGIWIAQRLSIAQYVIHLFNALRVVPSLAVAGLAFTPFALTLAALSRWAGRLADRIGPRLPLIVGPSLAGVGYLLMALVGLTHGPADYWTTFFPGIMVLGIGMGITVAPLTTAVMSSVSTHLAGTASGVNNAVSRTAGVLAIAVVGAVALLIFAQALATRSSSLPISAQAKSALQAQAPQLGAAAVPSQVAPGEVGAVEKAIRLSFVDAFRTVMLICAGLAWLSALMAALLVQNEYGAQG